MKLEEAIKTYNELKKYKEVIKNIDTNFFFKFAETVLQALENTQKNYELAIKQNITYKQNIYDLKNNAIPKKKIEDKILQEWQKYPKNSINDFAIVERNNKIQVLQELLED